MGRSRAVLAAASLALVGAGASCAFWDLDGFTGSAQPDEAGTRDATDATDATSVTDASDADPGKTDATVSRYQEEVLADRPLAYYRFDDAPGTVAKDSSGNAKDGVFVGSGIVFGVAGATRDVPNRAVRFGASGSKGYMRVGDEFKFPGKAPYTIEAWLAWVPTATFSAVCTRLDRGDADPFAGYILQITPTGQAQFLRVEPGFPATAMQTPPAFTGTFFTHVVVTYDSQDAAFYLNGSKVMTIRSAFSTTGAQAPFLVAADSELDGNAFVGMIDELAIYDGALSPTRISAHYRVGTGQTPL